MNRVVPPETFPDALLDDGALHGSPDGDVFELQLAELEVRLRLDLVGQRVGVVEALRLVLLLGDDSRLQELLGALELGKRDLGAGDGHIQVGLGLRVSVPHIPGIDLGQQGARLDLVAHVYMESKDLSGGLGLDLHRPDGLHGAGGFGPDLQITSGNRDGLEHPPLLRGFPRGAGRDRKEQHRSATPPLDLRVHVGDSACAFMKSFSIAPSSRWTCRLEYSAMLFSWVTRTMV